MKVVFLDIDGVVNCKHTAQRHRGYIGIDPEMAFRVGKIFLYTDAKMVLSSTWRLWDESRLEVQRQVGEIFDVTADLNTNWRGKEIRKWLNEHPEVTKYAILDDNADFYPEQVPNFFRTSWDEGITDEIMQKVIDHLNG